MSRAFNAIINKLFLFLVPSAPPESPRAWNLSSTSLHVRWGPIPLKQRHGKILGYQVEKIPKQQKHGRRKPTVNYTASRSLTFSGLKKFSKYVISVCALTRRGKGPSRSLIAQTDEDGKNVIMKRHNQRGFSFPRGGK